MSNYVIIRDLPKTTVSINLIYHETDENFIGFKDLTNSINHVAVKLKSGKFTGFWLFFEGGSPLKALLSDDSGTVIVKRYDTESDAIVEDTEENVKKYSEMALSGKLDDCMLDSYLKDRIPSWVDLTYYIDELGEVPLLNVSDDEKQSFTFLYNDVHSGDLYSLLAEFQFCFLRMLVGADEGYDQEAMRRWAQMMRFICNSKLDEVNGNYLFYIKWINVLFHQLKCLPTSVFQADDDNLLHLVIFSNAGEILDTIEQVDSDELKKMGKRYETYLKERAAGLE